MITAIFLLILPLKWRTYSALGIKNKQVSFVLHSFFRNFARKFEIIKEKT